ncbi:MAG: hypothetical protein Q9228_006155, partial [Teloschistes exilis]
MKSQRHTDYSWLLGLTDTAPQLGAATYRFTPATGAVHIVEDSLAQPNGIALAPDNRTVYISDTGHDEAADLSSSSSSSGAAFNASISIRTVYAYDLSPHSTYLTNKRPFYRAQEGVPDGLKVAANG